MAIDAHHILFSPPQFFSNRELMMNNTNNNTTMEPRIGTGFCNNNQTGYGVVSPYSVTDDSFLHMYGGSMATYYADGANNNVDCDFFPLTSRKRPRTSYTTTSPFSFLGQDNDISSHINQQHIEIDRFVSLHEKWKRQMRTIMEAIEHGIVKRLRVKEEERDRIGKMNHALEERVKSLSVENQFWRELAYTNEATANNLRTNLDHVLAQVNNVNYEDDAESCCGSSSGEDSVMPTLGNEAHDKTVKVRMCTNCGEGESCVLLLPCRHLCLCGVCGSTVHTCPICRSPKNASVHVNMSS